MSLSRGATFVYEPIRDIRWTDSALDHWGEEDLARIVPTMRDVFQCDPVRRVEGLVLYGAGFFNGFLFICGEAAGPRKARVVVVVVVGGTKSSCV